MPKIKTEAGGMPFADPEDDPKPKGRDLVNQDQWCERINSFVAGGEYVLARRLAIRYTGLAVKAVGKMEPPDSPMRACGYRYFQVNVNNWEEVLDELKFRIPEVPGVLSVEMQSAAKDAPAFIIHTPRIATQEPQTDAPAQIPAEADTLPAPDSHGALVNVVEDIPSPEAAPKVKRSAAKDELFKLRQLTEDDERLAEIAKRRSELPPR